MDDNRLPRSCSRVIPGTSAATLAFAFLLMVPFRTGAQALSQSVLVVYNSSDAASTDVANYYVTKRGIPSANLCAITPPSTTVVSFADFDSTVRTPIRNCLSVVGFSNILYIVFAYNTPYKVVAPDQITYALDQFIADILDVYIPPGQYGVPASLQPYYADSQSEGNVYVPFQSFADYRLASSVPVYSVWRLDAATSALAKGLVDKALLAESVGLSGQVCIDEKLPSVQVDFGEGANEWDLRQSATFSREAGFPVTEDKNLAVFGTSPAPLRCDNAALYAGWYTLNHYNDAFGWNPGAIGIQFDSASAPDPRVGTNWCGGALIHGITVTTGAVSEPGLYSFPHPDGVFRNLFEGANVGDAFMRNTPWLKWKFINMGDPLYRPFPSGFPAVTSPQNSFALLPQQVLNGKSSTGTITLATPAPAGGITVALKTDQPSYVTVPATTIIAAGQTTGSFPISTKLVTNTVTTNITAIFGTTTLANTLVVRPMLAAITVAPLYVMGGATSAGTVYLNDFAPSGGLIVNLSSSNSVVSVPPSVTVAEGTATASFVARSSSVPVLTTVTISATYSGAKLAATLVVKPLTPASVTLSPTLVVGGLSTTANKVTLSGPAPVDTPVSLSSSDPGVAVPPSVTVAAGQTVSPLFTITTSPVAATHIVTISAAYNGVTKTANLTVNPIVPTLLTLSPSSVVGGLSTTSNKVTLNSPASAGGIVVSLSSSDPGVTVPPSVTVAAGQTVSPLFTITTSPVAATSIVTISAACNGVTKTANLTVNP